MSFDVDDHYPSPEEWEQLRREGSVCAMCRTRVWPAPLAANAAEEQAIKAVLPHVAIEALLDGMREALRLIRLGCDESDGWMTPDLDAANAFAERWKVLAPVADIGVAGTAFDDAVQELVDAGLAVTDATPPDAIGAEWERVTRAAWLTHGAAGWSNIERQAIEDFILTARHSISEIPAPQRQP